jgi:Leucine-rich repeat (LRR) protein
MNFFFWTLLTITSYSTTKAKNSPVEPVNGDTTYSTSTQELKNNKIPDSIFQMTNLLHLSITGMDCDYGDRANCWMIKEIPNEIKNLKKLTTLRLTLNSVSTIPNGLTELNNLTLIDLTDNAGLNNIDNLAKLQNLEYLYLNGCGLTKLPDNIGDLKYLKKLGLVGNHLDNRERARIKKALPNCIIVF